MQHKILFQNGGPISPEIISSSLRKFPDGYKKVIKAVITGSEHLSEHTFLLNTAALLINFKMTRKGPFHGVKLNGNCVEDQQGNLRACWAAIGNDLLTIKSLLSGKQLNPRARTLLLLNQNDRKEIIDLLWIAFKKILPITMGQTSYGLVGASKILFSIFPEIVLPVDSAQWLNVFQTVDLSDVIHVMANEIKEWEKATKKQFDKCDAAEPTLTLPAIYNVMAMNARPQEVL